MKPFDQGKADALSGLPCKFDMSAGRMVAANVIPHAERAYISGYQTGQRELKSAAKAHASVERCAFGYCGKDVCDKKCVQPLGRR